MPPGSDGLRRLPTTATLASTSASTSSAATRIARCRPTGSASVSRDSGQASVRRCGVGVAVATTRRRRPGGACSGRWLRSEAVIAASVRRRSFMPRPPSRARAPFRALCRRHFAVPVGIPSARAISATGRSSTWWSARIARSSARSRSNALRDRVALGDLVDLGPSVGVDARADRPADSPAPSIGCTWTSRSRIRWRGHPRCVRGDPVSHGVNASGSRSLGSCCHAATNASWTASAASASLRRMAHASRSNGRSGW